MIANRIIGGNKGLTASIFVTGLSETDTVTATKDGRTYGGKWVSKPNTACVVPDGYTQLDYIESTGTQYIPCGLTSYTNLHVEIEFEHYTKTNDYWIFGNFIPNSTNYRRLGYYNNGYDASHNSTWTLSQTDFSTRTHAETTISGTYSYEMNMFSMMDYNTGNVNYHAASGRIYYLKMWSEDNLIREFVPCKRSSDNAIGMYDLVTNTFFVNSGTGTFVAGAEVPQTIDGFLIDNIKSYGTYTITATDGTNTTTQDVLVDMAIQYQIAMGYESNTLYLYYFGDECEDVTGGWISFTTEGSAVKAFYDSANSGYWSGGMGTFTKNSDNFYYSASTRNMADIQTVNAIDLTDYTYCVVKYTNIAQNRWGGAACGLVNNSVVNDFDLSTGSSISGLRNGSNTSYLVLADFTEIKTAVGNIANVYYQQESHNGTAASRVYMMAFSKSDDISSLSSYGSTISSIISNSASLLSNETAIKNMINKCTGDFMWTALSDSTFVNNLKASAHYSIVSSDSNWKKALSLLDIL